MFVADFMWITPLGMFINAQDNGRLGQTTEWIKIRGDQLVPRDGYYDVRVNANLWETHFFDHLSLIAVDHPTDTEMFVDERFSPAAAGPEMQITSPPRPIASSPRSGRQGCHRTRHSRRRPLPRPFSSAALIKAWPKIIGSKSSCPKTKTTHRSPPHPLTNWLLATGWIHPTDSSINFALAQGHARSAARAVARNPRWQWGLEGCSRRSRFSRRQEQDDGHPPRRHRRTRCPASIPAADEHGNLLGRPANRRRAGRFADRENANSWPRPRICGTVEYWR